MKQKEEFKDRYAQALSDSDLSAAEVSRITGISESTLSQYKSGYATPKKDRLQIIANALRVSPSWLMGLDVGKCIVDSTASAVESIGRSVEDMMGGLSDKELSLIKAYRKADNRTQLIVDMQLGLDIQEPQAEPKLG